MKTLYLHVGWRKTGSSAIQSLITENLRDDCFGDLCVPPIGTMRQRNVFGGQDPIAHHRLGRLDREDQAKTAWQNLAEYVANSEHERFLISTEALSGKIEVAGKYTPQLRQRLKMFDRVVFLVWLRRQDEYMASMYAQLLKDGIRPRERHFPIGPLPDAYYYHLLERFLKTHHNAEMKIFLYRHKGGDVLDQFIQSVGVDRTALNMDLPRGVNARVTPTLYRLQGIVNYGAMERGLDAASMQIPLMRAAEHSGVTRDEPQGAIAITHEHRQWSENRYAVSNDRLCARFELERDYFSISEDDWKTLPEFNIPDTVPVDYIDRILDALDQINTKPGSPMPDVLRKILGGARNIQIIRRPGGKKQIAAMRAPDAAPAPVRTAEENSEPQ